jgi:hypothetical protein
MKQGSPKRLKSASTPATNPAINAGAPSDRERAPLTLVEPAAESVPPTALPFPSFAGDPHADAKELLQTLEFQVARYPQFTSILELAIQPLRAQMHRRPKSDRNLVFDVITAFDSVPMEELIDDTQLSAARVCAAVLELIEVGLVDCRTSGRRAGTKLDPSVKEMLGRIFARPDHKHLKGDYRAEHLFCHTTVPAGSNFSSPKRGHSATRAMADYLQD